MTETWKTIKNFPRYVVSNQGRVQNQITGKFIKPWKARKHKNYQKVELWSDTTFDKLHLHRVVADAFIPNPKNKPFINHKDGNPKNNSVENLEWVTHEENLRWNKYLTFERVLSSLTIDPDVYTKLIKEASQKLSPVV